MDNKLDIYRPESSVPSEWKEFLAELPQQARLGYEDYFYERKLWEELSNQSTPLNMIEEREGHKVDGVVQILEYIPEEYTLSELNRLFPGWWTENMKRNGYEEIAAFETVVVEGYLCVPYPTPSGTKVRKLWAIAGNDIKFKQGTKTPVDIGNNFKGARTEWIRIAGKWYGIGLEIYHQNITPQMRSSFEDWCRTLEVLSEYDDEYLKSFVAEKKKVVETIETGQGFRNFLKDMPNPTQISHFYKSCKVIPSQEKQIELWTHFLKFNNKSPKATKQLEEWVSKVVKKVEVLKEKLSQNKTQGD